MSAPPRPLTTLELIVTHQIRTRHRLMCSRGDARRALAALRRERAALANREGAQ